MIAELFPCVNDVELGNNGFASGGTATTAAAAATTTAPLPSFEEFLKHICRRTRTPLTCMCLALLYLTRLRANHPRSRGSPGSSYRLALSSLCVATKYLYDDAYHTCSWVQVSMGLFNQREVNQMEMEFMYFLHYQLGVTPTEWNQWIATLEAKLVSRWQEKGKAEVIYGFGLFLSYECCEPNAQETVRDIAWGEGGKSLLTMLNNAIHLPGEDTFGKGSPSADSAVSDTTCLPTPDPNSWFRIRSPAAAAAGARSSATSASVVAPCSNSITPTTAQFAEISGFGDDSGTAPNAKPHPSTYLQGRQYGSPACDPSPKVQKYSSSSSNAGISRRGGPPAGPVHPLRPSSVCSMPGVVPSASGYSYESSTHSNSRYVPHAHPSSRRTYHHALDSNSQDWGAKDAGGTIATTSPSHPLSVALRDNAGATCHPSSVSTGSSSQNQTYFVGDSRPLSSVGHGAYNMCSGGMSIDRKCGHSTSMLPRLSSVGGTGQLSGERNPALSSSSAAVDSVSCRNYIANGQQGSDSTVPENKATKDLPIKGLMRFGAPSTLAAAYTVHGDGAETPYNAFNSNKSSNSNSHGSIRYMGTGAGISNASCAASTKSSISSLKTAGRRQSWRNSSKNTGTSFAQRLRSFAVFNWGSGGGGNGGGAVSSNNSSKDGADLIVESRPSAKPPMPCGSDELSGFVDREQDTERGFHDHSLSLSTATATMRAVSNSSASNASGRFGYVNRRSCCPSQISASSGTYSAESHYLHQGHSLSNIELAKRPDGDFRSKRLPIANVRHALSSVASPSYDFELEMSKYVSMKS
ncbi:hypothetical protein EV177_002475 [Coemansia sp. RSA 1804]|nr:hypothetical protein EV177_002475 [Coemansia sp. RSA 1804]